MLVRLAAWFWNKSRWEFAERHWIIASLAASVLVLAPFALLILASGKGSVTTRVIVIGIMTVVGCVAALVRMHQDRQSWPDGG